MRAESTSGAPTEFVWQGEQDRLDRVLPKLGLARSRSQAAELIAAGGVRVNDAIATKAGLRVDAGARIDVPRPDRYVSRGAHKLIAGLDHFGIDPADRIALDLGASTGGFTQVLLERGARVVQAVDVGHDQLAPKIRADSRVRVMEGCNARELDAARLATGTEVEEPPDLVVADLSFISLRLILPAIARCAAGTADLVLLIKPQFEVGRVRDGVVSSAEQRAEAMRIVLSAASECGFAARSLETSPIAGGSGNIEYLSHFIRTPSSIWPSEKSACTGRADPTEWDERIRGLSEQGPAKQAQPS